MFDEAIIDLMILSQILLWIPNLIMLLLLSNLAGAKKQSHIVDMKLQKFVLKK